MTGEADVAHLPLALRLVERVHDATFGEMPLGVVVVHALVYLPEIEIIGAQTLQRFLELTHRDFRVTSMRAHLGHQKDHIAPVVDGLPHTLFALAFVILPGVVKKVDAGLNGFVNDADGLGGALGLSEVIAAQTDD